MLKEEKINIYQLYSLFFIIMCLAVFAQFIISGRTLIWDADGKSQHLPAYIYYGKYLRTIFHTIFIEHSFHIPQWDFTIGEGCDILQCLNYYAIGDPFAFFSFLFPPHLTYVYYIGMCIARIYCAGIAFIYLCRVMGHSEKVPVLAGTLMYALSYWSIFNVARHPYFINPLIWFPFLIAEIERIIQGKKPFLYILFVTIAAVSSFYFFYMLVLLVALYILIRLFYLYGSDLQKICRTLLSFLVYSCLALGLAASLFLPICYIFLHDARMTHFTDVLFFYPRSYYSILPLSLLYPQGHYYLRLGFPVLSVVSLMMLFKEPKKNCFLLILLSCCIVFIMFPFFGFILNGFSYVSNRWSWAFALLCSYIVVVTWEQLLKAGRVVLPLILSLAIYAISLKLQHQCAFAFYILFLIIYVLTSKTKKDTRSIIAFLLICINIVLNANIRYYGDIAEYLTATGLDSVLLNETALIKQAASGDSLFFRYSGKDLTHNASLNQNLSAVSYYWTLSNPYVMEFRKKTELPGCWMAFNYGDYDSRATLESLACVKYFYKNDNSKEIVPYGFLPTGIESVYKSSYSMPLAYTYDSFMTRESWDALDCVKKSEALLQTAVLEDPCDEVPRGAPSFSSKGVPFSITKNSSSFSIKPEAQEAGELYVCLKNLRNNNPKGKRLVVDVKTSNGNDIPFIYVEPGHQWYYALHDISVNLGYSEKSIEEINIIFPKGRLFVAEDIQMISLPMTRFASLIDERRKDTFDNMVIGVDKVEGNISLDKPKLLCFAIPFAKGWEATVDGKPAKLLRTNVMHMSVPLSAGEHRVVLTYHTPFLRLGVLISLCSWAIFLFWVYRSRRKGIIVSLLKERGKKC